ncbi:MAG: hypothetical protein DRP29_06090 [Thermodesulfobacteriota bacterium]|nr:MAG: hypothetical protein DRP29_06090 [Thermodesulfobacteriota bacterium]
MFSRDYWTIVHQGMNTRQRLARRYHWDFSRHWKGLEKEKHSGIMAEKREKEVMNLISQKSSEARELIVDLVKDRSFKKDYKKLISAIKIKAPSKLFLIPRRIDWEAVEKAYNLQPDNFENLLLIKGIGKATLRALALISDLIYNVNYDKEDPAKYSFALGGKDGVPFPVDRKRYDEVIEFMEEVVKQTELGEFEKKQALERLAMSLRR